MLKKSKQPLTNDVIWQPHKKQSEFLSTTVDECLFGGANGGGKSDAIMVLPLRWIYHPEFRAVIFRRNTKSLRRIIDRTMQIYKKVEPQVHWSEQKLTYTFPSGAKIYLFHMEHENNKYDWEGIQLNLVCFDEITSFTEEQYMYLFSRIRSTSPELPKYMRATGTPSGDNIGWVKKHFIDICKPNKIYRDGTTKLTRQYIPATVDDNPSLRDTDPNYENRLRAVGDEKTYRRLRFGDWTIVEGSAFEELDESVHKIKDFELKSDDIIIRSMDWGFAKPFAVLWAVQREDAIIVFKEWYGTTGRKLDEGLRMSAEDVAKQIVDSEKSFPVQVALSYCDPACWSKINQVESIADIFMNNSVFFLPAKNDRIMGKQQIHLRLKLNEHREAKLYIHESCHYLWQELQNIQLDPRRSGEDVKTQKCDHAYDALRYGLMSSPVGSDGNSDVYLGGTRATHIQEF